MFLLYLFIRKTERYLACAKSVLVFSQKFLEYQETRLFGFVQYFSDLNKYNETIWRRADLTGGADRIELSCSDNSLQEAEMIFSSSYIFTK